jgi:ribosomal protein S18 acetylase RimI-like enzyme
VPYTRRPLGEALHIVIRRLQVDDLATCFTPQTRALGAEWLARQEREELYVAVAEVDGAPVGHRCLDFTYNPETGAAYCFAANVWPEWRSRGIGSSLDEHFAEVARAKGFRALRCVVAKHNTRARSWHERLGYHCIGDGEVRWTEPDGRAVAVDCWHFERPLFP